MPDSVIIPPRSPLTDPDIRDITSGDVTLKTSDRYLQHVSSTTANRRIIAASKASYRIYNGGSQTILVGSTGNADTSLKPGQSVLVEWDVETQKHVIVKDAATPSLPSVATYADARALTTTVGQLVVVEGRNAAGDGGQGFFQDIGLVSSFSGITDDDGYHLFTTGGTRVLRRQGPIEPEHYGGSTSLSFDNAPIIAKMEAARAKWEATLQFRRRYRCDSMVTFENYGSDIIMEGSFWFPKGYRGPGIKLARAPSGADTDGNSPKYLFRDEKDWGPGTPDPEWSSNSAYVYADTFDETTIDSGGQTVAQRLWAETECGILLDGITRTEVEYEAIGFAIGLLEDTQSNYSAWNEIKSLNIKYCKFAYVLKVRADRTQVVNQGWANRGKVKLNATNLGGLLTPQSSYGIVLMSDPAHADPYVPSEWDCECSHEGFTTGGKEACPIVIVNGHSITWKGRNDQGGLKYRVFDQLSQPDRSSYANTDIELIPHMIFDDTQWDIDTGTNVVVRSPGVTRPVETLVDASELAHHLTPGNVDEFRARNQYLGFQDSTVQLTPRDKSWIVLTDWNLDGTINTDAASVLRGGIGAWVDLGNKKWGGALLISVSTKSDWRVGCMCYDASDVLITSDSSMGWLVREQIAHRGQTSYALDPTAYAGEWKGANHTSNDDIVALRFHESVASAFVFVWAQSLEGFRILADTLPGCRPRKLNPGLPLVDVQPAHGVFSGPAEFLNSDPSATPRGWRHTTSGTAEAIAGTWSVSMTVKRNAFYKNSAGDIWRPTGGFASGQANSSKTAGTDEPTGTGPYTDNAGITWSLWKFAPVTTATFATI